MALRLGETVKSVRLRHPAFADPAVVPTVTLVDAATTLQRKLALLGTQKNSGWLAQRIPIFLAADTNNQPQNVRAGSAGGLPAQDDSSQPVLGTAGDALGLDTSSVQFGPFVPTGVSVGVTQTVITRTGAGRTINADIGLSLKLEQGQGAGPEAVRTVISNTATSWTVLNFSTAPALTTVVNLVQTAMLTGPERSVFTAMPGTDKQVGYLVKLDASGTPYLDLTAPLVATMPRGVQLPPFDRVLGLQVAVRPIGQLGTDWGFTLAAVPDGTFVSVPIFDHQLKDRVSAWMEGSRLFLGGPAAAWAGYRHLVLSYVPIPPAFDTSSRTVLDDLFLLPDTAADVLECGLAITAGRQAQARGKEIDVLSLVAEYEGAQSTFLKSIGQRQGALTSVTLRNR